MPYKDKDRYLSEEYEEYEEYQRNFIIVSCKIAFSYLWDYL